MNAYITVLCPSRKADRPGGAILASVDRRGKPHAQVCGAIPGQGGTEGSAGHAGGEGVREGRPCGRGRE